jgi:hypothetical protein
MVGSGWLKGLLDTAQMPQVGIVSPVFRGSSICGVSRPLAGCALMETFSLSFATLLLRGEMHKQLGVFDEGLDGGEWCLKDYIRRAEDSGFRTCVTGHPELICGQETVFGSQERRQEQSRLSRDCYLSRWGNPDHYCLYFGQEVLAGDLYETVESIVAGARHGHRFTLLLHRKQFKEFRKRGWNGLHTGITISQLPLFAPGRSLARQIAALQSADPNLILVRGAEGALFPGSDSAIAFDEIAATRRNNISSHLNYSLEVV